MVHSYQFFDAPGVFTRCNKIASCSPYADRDQTSLDFLCCEDQGWVASHIMNPALIGLLFGWKAAFIAAFWFEVYEITVLILFDSFVFTTTSDLDRETITGSVIGDAFLNGSLGGILAYQICELVMFTPPFQRWKQMASNWHRAKYVALFVLLEGCFLLPGLSNISPPLVLVTVLAVFIAFKLVVEPLTNFAADVALVWRGQKGVRARNNAFLLYVVVAIIIFSQNAGLQYMSNDYFQCWFAAIFVIFTLGMLLKNKK